MRDDRIENHEGSKDVISSSVVSSNLWQKPLGNLFSGENKCIDKAKNSADEYVRRLDVNCKR